MKEYKVEVTEFYIRWYNLENQLHRENGPAVEYANGGKAYYINGNYLTEQKFNDRNNPCTDKMVEIDGVKYKLTKI